MSPRKPSPVENEQLVEVLDTQPAAVSHDAGLARVEDQHPTITSTEFAMAAARAVRAIVMKHSKMIGGRRYIEVEAWQAIANAMGCVASARDVKKEDNGFSAVGEVRRMSDGVVISTGEGFVGNDENLWARRPEYARRAMTQTRSISRACRSAFAFIAVMVDPSINPTPAEEMPDEDPPRSQGGAQSRTPTAAPAAPPQDEDVNAGLKAYLDKQNAEPKAKPAPVPAAAPLPPVLENWDNWLAQNVAIGMVEERTAIHLRMLLSHKMIHESEITLAQKYILDEKQKNKQEACVKMADRLQQLAEEREAAADGKDLLEAVPDRRVHSQARPVRRWPKMSGGR